MALQYWKINWFALSLWQAACFSIDFMPLTFFLRSTFRARSISEMGLAMLRKKWKWQSWWGIPGNSCATAKRMLLWPSLIMPFTRISKAFISLSKVAMLSLSADWRFLARSVFSVSASFRIQRVSLPFSGWTPSSASVMPPLARILSRVGCVLLPVCCCQC